MSQDAVIEAALTVLERDGLDAVTGTRIADELGVTQPALYRHVEGMEEVWRGLGLQIRSRLVDALNEAAAGRSGADAVVAVANAWRRFANEHRSFYAATDRHPCAGDPELEAAVEEVVAVLARTVRGYRLDDTSSIDAARMLRSFLHGFVHLEHGDGHPSPYDTDASFERIVRLLTTVLDIASPGSDTRSQDGHPE